MPASQSRASKSKPSGPPPDDDSFVYTAPNGKTITLPSMAKALNAKEMRKYRGTSQLEILFYVIERDNPAVEDKDGGETNPALDALDEALESMSLDVDVPALIEEWQEWSRISMGKSNG